MNLLIDDMRKTCEPSPDPPLTRPVAARRTLPAGVTVARTKKRPPPKNANRSILLLISNSREIDAGPDPRRRPPNPLVPVRAA
ncbi:MAG: hypothetical protein A3H32_19285 [Betaproteobacteria bacterium RIFCSPLOWO2_02_FULL_63_19]|nr:MAG: hypothetical protein A3H32_19285 [Betaproteobacteria bacterium RIFCSPLOWO2_02_FULL_63_19]